MPPRSSPIGGWSAPTRGILRGVPIHELPKDALWHGHNVFVRDGVLRPRPSIVRVPNSIEDASTGTPTGAFFFHNAADESIIVIGTSTGIYSRTGPTNRKRTIPVGAFGTAPAFSGTLTGDLDHPSRFTILQFGTPGVVWCVHTNGVDPLLQWNGVDGNFIPVAGDGAFTEIATLVGTLPASPASGSITFRVANPGPEILTPEILAILTRQVLTELRAVLRINQEIFNVTGWDPTTSTVTAQRAYRNTTAQAHPEGSAVEFENDRPAPIFADLMTVGDHIMGIIPPYELAWGNIRTLSEWPKLNRRFLAETTDRKFACRALGTMGGAVYGTDSLFTVRYVGGNSEASAFVVEYKGPWEGPASAACVVDVEGMHVYFTPSGRVGGFDGSTQKWLADAIWPLTRDLVDRSYAHRAFGVYDSTYNEVLFVFPRKGLILGQPVDDRGIPKGLLIITLPKDGVGPTQVGAWLGSTAALWNKNLTCGVAYALGDRAKKVGLYSNSTAASLYNWVTPTTIGSGGVPVGEATDAGVPFEFSWQTGLQGLGAVGRIESFTHYLSRDANYGALTFRGVRSYGLWTPDGERGREVPINLEDRLPEPNQGVDLRGLFHGCWYEYTPPAATSQPPYVRWYGAASYGHATS